THSLKWPYPGLRGNKNPGSFRHRKCFRITRVRKIKTRTPMAINHRRGLVAPVRCTALASYCRASRVWVLSRRLYFSCKV
ncbi:hypothetical protein ED312_03875, partial [Sinomicrobium pectinilyticum]